MRGESRTQKRITHNPHPRKTQLKTIFIPQETQLIAFEGQYSFLVIYTSKFRDRTTMKT